MDQTSSNEKSSTAAADLVECEYEAQLNGSLNSTHKRHVQNWEQ